MTLALKHPKLFFRKLPQCAIIFLAILFAGNVVHAQSPPISTFPFCEDFDGSADGFDSTWVNDLNADINWSENSGGTLTSNTGPDGDHTSGNGNYIYTEASGNYNETALLVSPSLNLEELEFPYLEFYYHMYGQDIGELEVEVYADGSWETVWTKSGQQHGSSGADYSQAMISLKPYQESGTRVRIRGTTGPSARGDMAVDGICVFDSCDNISNPVDYAGGIEQENDTAFINSPATFNNQFAGGEDVLNYHYWYVDGVLQSESYDFQHAFGNTGEHEVKLVSQTCADIDTFEKTVDVKTPNAPPRPEFTAVKNVVNELDTFRLIDLTKGGPTSWQWDIQPEGPAFDPRYVVTNNLTNRSPRGWFLRPGLYTVCLTASNSAGTSDQHCKEQYIAVRDVENICNADRSTEFYGKLRDDGEDGDYSASENTCSYTIAPCADSIRLEFREFELAQGDHLRIYDGQDDSGTPLWDVSTYGEDGLTGDMSNPEFKSFLTAASGHVYIEFEKDGSGSAKGFELDWESDSGNYNQPEAQFDAPDTVCRGEEVRFNNQTEMKNPAYQWEAPTETAASKNFTYSFQNYGEQEVRLIAEGCAGTDTLTKTVYVNDAAPEADFEAVTRPVPQHEVVTLNQTSEHCPESFEWSITPDSFRYVNNTDANSRNPQVIFEDTSCYEVQLIATNEQGNDTITKPCYINPVDYCIPRVNNLNSDIGINRVQLSSLDNQSASGQTGYTSYNGNPVRLELGEKLPIDIRRNTAKNDVNWKVWIDFNRDGDFTDAGELVLSTGRTSQRIWKDSVQVTDTAKTGVSRMRVGISYGDSSNNKVCGPNNFGEFEDYMVRLVPDETPPVISLEGPDPLTLEACEGLAGKDTGAVVTDNVDGNITNNLQVDASGVQEDVPGTYFIHYNAQDAAGNAAEEVKREVRVLADTTKPALTLNGDKEDTLRVDSAYQEPGYQVDDNCGAQQVDVNINSGVDSSTLGTYAIVYEAVDTPGNATTKERTVHVADLIAPELTLNGDDTIRTGVRTPFQDPGYTATDNYDNNLDVEVSGTVDTLHTGTYTLTYSVTDASGNGPVQKQRTVIVEDTQAPVVEKASEQDTLTLDVFNELQQPALTVEDNHDRRRHLTALTRGSFTSHFPDLVADSLGIFRVVYAFTDRAGNSDSVVYQVKVVDREAPEILLEGPEAVTIDVDETHNQGIDTVIDNYDQTPVVDSSGSYFDEFLEDPALGTYEKHYTATDQSGNTTQKTVHVFVDETSGLADEEENVTYKIYPNPTQGDFTLQLALKHEQTVDIAVTDANGQKVKTSEANRLKSGEIDLNLTGYATGTYFVHILTEHGRKVVPVSLVE